MIRIQLVDDEPNILSSLRRLLKPQGWQVDTFNRVEGALGGLLEHEYAVIVSDYQMPTADGVTYLQFAKQKQPHAIRLVLSAYGDRESMIKAINQAEVYRYLSKPWDDYEVVAAIKSAIDLYQLQKENQRLREENDAQRAMIKAREEELLRLESDNPGITRVRRDADGSVLLTDD
ncbi:response regulator [Marinobacter nauticus]|uniref:response regulator n=1 Tax=Marinobacter nauticus TaxID=2743 RepID=UPI001C9433D4|nr:response regulator [Marinobacter nauticus]MBY6221886.1 response regulator [Marinobacter nauticus]